MEVKKIARQLLAKLKREKFILDWRLQRDGQSRCARDDPSGIRRLPEVYERKLWDEKVERTYQFVFEHFGVVQANVL